MSTLAYIGLGSNLGPREAQIDAALGELARCEGLRLRRRSTLHETEPVGGPPQGTFLNGAAELEVDIPAASLLRVLLDVERRLGRVRTVADGPRPIDLDLLLYGDERVELPDLVIPHPRLRERAFVLAPLAELAPGLPVPPDGRTVGDLLARLNGRPEEGSAPGSSR